MEAPKQFQDKTKAGVLPAFLGSKYLGKQQGDKGKSRATWELEDGKIAQWDYKKGEVEIYNRTRDRHFGGYDPYTSKQTSKADSSRTAKRR